MPKFLRIGVHQSNVSGYTSKAWCVRRVGSTVFLKWGAVEVHGVGDGRKIYWTLPPRAKTIRCGTVLRAKDYAKTAIARRRNHRYEPLAGNIAIWRRPADRGADLEQALATILFVDIVRSTEKAAQLGDSRWTPAARHEHEDDMIALGEIAYGGSRPYLFQDRCTYFHAVTYRKQR